MYDDRDCDNMGDSDNVVTVALVMVIVLVMVIINVAVKGEDRSEVRAVSTS